MSNYRGNREKCPCCGLSYKDFKTGLTYNDVFLWLWSQNDDSATWKYKRRRTVLGVWHGHKKQLWQAHLFECALEEKTVRKARALGIPRTQYVEGVPF